MNRLGVTDRECVALLGKSLMWACAAFKWEGRGVVGRWEIYGTLLRMCELSKPTSSLA